MKLLLATVVISAVLWVLGDHYYTHSVVLPIIWSVATFVAVELAFWHALDAQLARSAGPNKRIYINFNWQQQGACYQTDRYYDLFFPESPDPKPELTQAVINQFCKVCPVQQECFMHAITLPEEFGIWGGFTEQQRKEIRLQIKQNPRQESAV